MNLFLAITVLLFSFSTVFAFAESNDIDALIKQSFNEIEAKNFKQANILIDKALAIDPNNIAALNNKAVIFANLGDISQALSYIDKALEIDENNILSLYNKALVLESQGNYYDAIPYFIETLGLDKNYKSAREKFDSAIVKSGIGQRLIDGFMQMTVRNSDGTLVAHYQTPNFSIFDHEYIKYFIEKNFKKMTIIRDSHEVEVLHFSLPFNIDHDNTELGLWWVNHVGSGLKIIKAKTPIINLNQGDTIMASFYIFSFD